MVAKPISTNYTIPKAQSLEVTNNTTASSDEGYENCCFTAEKPTDYSKILSQTTISLNKFANSHYKTTVMLEPNEIDHIKDSLNNYKSDDSRVTEFKNQLLGDLTDFQKQIKTNYSERIADYRKQQLLCEKQIQILNVEKHKLIMNRLSKIAWPYDDKTKEYDNKIAMLTTQSQQYAQKATQAEQMRPAANEKDVLLYQMKLKDKYSKTA